MSKPKKGRAPALTIEGREQYMVSIAESLAEKQILEGTASSQVISHYLKLGTKREELERQELEHKNELLKAKTEAIRQDRETAKLYEEAMKMYKVYQGNGGDDGDDQDF